MSSIVSSKHPIAQNIAEAVAMILGAKVIRATYENWITEGNDREDNHWYIVTFANGFILHIGRASYNKPLHFNIYPEFPKDSKGESCKPYNKESITANILRNSNAKRICHALTKYAEQNRETYEESLKIQSERNTYYSNVNSAMERFTNVKGWKKCIHKENNITSTNGCDGGYGDVEVFNNSANVNIRNVSHDVALAIMQLVAKSKGV